MLGKKTFCRKQPSSHTSSLIRLSLHITKISIQSNTHNSHKQKMLYPNPSIIYPFRQPQLFPICIHAKMVMIIHFRKHNIFVRFKLSACHCPRKKHTVFQSTSGCYLLEQLFFPCLCECFVFVAFFSTKTFKTIL